MNSRKQLQILLNFAAEGRLETARKCDCYET